MLACLVTDDGEDPACALEWIPSRVSKPSDNDDDDVVLPE